jgi:hypothetical protein
LWNAWNGWPSPIFGAEEWKLARRGTVSPSLWMTSLAICICGFLSCLVVNVLVFMAEWKPPQNLRSKRFVTAFYLIIVTVAILALLPAILQSIFGMG